LSAPIGDDAPIFLVGFMGCGKTTVGRALALRLGWEFADTDELVERAEGRSVETIFVESGEGRFREAEWEALRSLSGRRRIVVATGGGLFLGVAQRRLVRASGWSCWLDVPLSVVASRVPAGEPRPLWPATDALARRAMFERRRAAYALADRRIDASTYGPDELAEGIEALKNSLWR
jgi:shikimate kinase